MSESTIKYCTECDAEFTPKLKGGKQQTCGAAICVNKAKCRKRYAKVKEAKAKGGGAYNKDGTIKEFYLVRGPIAYARTGSTMEADIS